MKAIICIANIAGRVGKSMTAASVAAELALRGHPTLLIDADPQAFATEYFMAAEEVRLSLADVIVKRGYGNQSWPGAEQQREYRLPDVIVPTGRDSLDLVPSKISLARFEREPDLSIFQFKGEIEAVKDSYEYVIIDTPPYLGQILTACLIASTHLMIPVAPMVRAQEGPDCVLTLFEQVRLISPDLELLGVFYNLLDRDNPFTWELVKNKEQRFKGKAFKSMIYSDYRLMGCWAHHQTIQTLAPKSPGAAMIASLTDEILDRLHGSS
jgi:chromosome partitioning protein